MGSRTHLQKLMGSAEPIEPMLKPPLDIDKILDPNIDAGLETDTNTILETNSDRILVGYKCGP